MQGEVKDENASAMGGIAGHAGLFGDALSVARFAACMLRGGRAALPGGDGSTVYGAAEWRRREARGRWDGIRLRLLRNREAGFRQRSFGHLGYTGTSLWCDAERGLSVTLLTNRTWPDGRNQAIKELRPRAA